MQCLNLIIIHRQNGQLASVATSKRPELFANELHETRGWKKAEVFNSAAIRLSSGEAKLVSRLFELSASDDALDFDTFKKLLAKFGLAGFTMLPPAERQRSHSRR